MKAVAAALFAAGLSGASLGAEFDAAYPSRGIVYGQLESRSVVYDCKLNKSTDRLSCDFLQTTLRTKTSPRDLPEVEAKAAREWDGQAPEIQERMTQASCSASRRLLDLLDGKTSAPDTGAFAAMSDHEKSVMRLNAQAMAPLCDSVSKTRWLEAARAIHEIETRICVIASDKWTQVFKRVPNTSGIPVWVADDKAEGECGLVRLDRWERETPSTRDVHYWNFYTRKAVTNPSGNLLLGNCSDLDQAEYPHSWRSKTTYQQCDQVEFSAF